MMMDEAMSNLMIPGPAAAALLVHTERNVEKVAAVDLLGLHSDDVMGAPVVRDCNPQHCRRLLDHHTVNDVEEDGKDNDLDYFQMMVVVAADRPVLYMGCNHTDHLFGSNREYREVFRRQKRKGGVGRFEMVVFHLLVANRVADVDGVMTMAAEVRIREDRNNQELHVDVTKVVAAVHRYHIDLQDEDGAVMKDDEDEMMAVVQLYCCYYCCHRLLPDNLSSHDFDQDPVLHFDVMTSQPRRRPLQLQKDLRETSVDDVTVTMVVCYWSVAIVMPTM
jgi:hypothetical protein